MIRVLVDARIDARDGIGRYTRGTVEALRACTEEGDGGGDPHELDLHVLHPTGTPRYTDDEDAELVERAAAVGADVVHALNYRVPVALDRPTVVTVHDSAHLVAPELCFTDEDVSRYFGEATLRRLRRAVPAVEGLSAHAAYFRGMLRHALTSAARVIVPTRALAADLRAFVPWAPLVVTPWGVDHLPRDAPAAPVDGSFVLFVSVARAYKGIGELAAAFRDSRAARTGTRLALAGGRCEPGGQAAKELHDRGVDDAVLLGDVDDATLTALYRSAAVLVHPARYESFGFPPAEALSQGCPVVANDLPALREVLGGDATFVDATDTRALADAIDLAVLRPARPRPRLVSTWRRHAADLLEAYRRAAS